MKKFIFALVCLCLFSSCHAIQTDQDIIDYCTRVHSGHGSSMIVSCIEYEMEDRNKLQRFQDAVNAANNK